MNALFDLSFKKFVTPSLIKIIYILVMIMLAIGYISFVVVAFDQSTGFGFLTLLILGPLFVLIYLALARAALESLVAQIRTAENTAELVRLFGTGGAGTASTNYTPPTSPAPGNPPINPYQQ